MRADEKSVTNDEPTMAIEELASGHWRRYQAITDGRTGETYTSAQSIRKRTWEAQPPARETGLDRLRLMRRKGVGAVIVVGDG